MTNVLLEAALGYASAGIAIFPCVPRSKHPAIKDNLKCATTDESMIRSWWSQWPNANIGMPTGQKNQRLVIDPDGPEGEQSLTTLVAEYSPLPETFEVKTGRADGGRHIHFKISGVETRSKASALGPHLDVKGDGGYVLLPPSIHPDTGQEYRVIHCGEPADPPAWLVGLVRDDKKRTKAGAENKGDEKIPHGQRNERLFKLAAGYRAKGNSEETIFKKLKIDYEDNCEHDPPMSDGELRTLAKQGAKFDPGQVKQEAPCQDPVDPIELVADVENFIQQFVRLPRGMGLAIALWAIGTHLFTSFEVFPYLAITGPAKRCGKTRLTEVLQQVCAVARRTSNISEAALFRIIEAQTPTLIIDEAEALSDKRNERSQLLVGILNSGHRVGANVVRCVGPQHEVREFRTFCPKCIVAIGSLRDTLADRSLMVKMKRKDPSEEVARFLFKKVEPQAKILRGKIARAVADHRASVEKVFETIDFNELEDREAENWSPLLALCEVLAPGRLLDLRVTAVLNGKEKEKEDADESLSIRLLTDIREVLGGLKLDSSTPDGLNGLELSKHELFMKQTNSGIPSRVLLAGLKQIEESPWGEDDFKLTLRGLAHRLHAFGLYSTVIDSKDGVRLKGYKLSALLACLTVYVPSGRTSVQVNDKKRDK